MRFSSLDKILFSAPPPLTRAFVSKKLGQSFRIEAILVFAREIPCLPFFDFAHSCSRFCLMQAEEGGGGEGARYPSLFALPSDSRSDLRRARELQVLS